MRHLKHVVLKASMRFLACRFSLKHKHRCRFLNSLCVFLNARHLNCVIHVADFFSTLRHSQLHCNTQSDCVNLPSIESILQTTHKTTRASIQA